MLTKHHKITIAAASVALAIGVHSLAPLSKAQTAAKSAVQYTKDGKLLLPEGYRRWVYIGAPLTPNGLNGGKAGFPEFHNVYVEPSAFDVYTKTGTFPEGTIIVKELVKVQRSDFPDGSAQEASGRGYFQGDLNGADVLVKDAKRYAATRGWGFFNFGHHAPPYEASAALAPRESCASCHEANAGNTDMVFQRFYPVLKANLSH